uniref:Uncharacterized protein MANES_11G142100 n=1 Tax=Rhizophora mucronata TaxID=61149 RepID=A0A2P2MH75_RHIMU
MLVVSWFQKNLWTMILNFLTCFIVRFVVSAVLTLSGFQLHILYIQ